MVYFIDTNVFARLILEDNRQMYEECDKVLEKVRVGKIQAVTSTLVLAELGWLLKSYYELSKTKVVQSLKGTGSLNGLKIKGESDWIRAINLYERFSVKLTDAMIASIPEVISQEWTVLSYDEDFKKLPVKWTTPGEI